jgi:hypothetical protein
MANEEFDQHKDELTNLANETNGPAVLVETSRGRRNIYRLDEWPRIGTILFIVFPAKVRPAKAVLCGQAVGR